MRNTRQREWVRGAQSWALRLTLLSTTLLGGSLDAQPTPTPVLTAQGTGWYDPNPPPYTASPGRDSFSYPSKKDPTPRGGESSSSLYDRLQSTGGQDKSVDAKAKAAPLPGSGNRGYRFRGDGETGVSPEVPGADYRYRPLTDQELERGQATPGWRPMTPADRGALPPPLPGNGPMGPPGVAPAPYPGPGDDGFRPKDDHEQDNWFDRHFGRDRR